MSKKNRNKNVTESKKNAQEKLAVAQRVNPVVTKFKKLIESIDKRITAMSAKVSTGMTEEEKKKLVDAFEAKVQKMREKFDARLAKKNGGAKLNAKIDALKFEREQYEKALAIFEAPKTEEKK